MVDALENIGFQGKHDNERYHFHYYRHWVKIVLPFMVLVGAYAAVFLLFTFVVTPNLSDPALRRSAAAIFVLIAVMFHFHFVREFYLRFLYVVIVTDRMVHRIHKTLFFCDDHQSIDLQSVQDVKRIKHGILPNLLNYGDILLEAQETTLHLHYVPKVKHVHENLLKLQSGVAAE